MGDDVGSGARPLEQVGRGKLGEIGDEVQERVYGQLTSDEYSDFYELNEMKAWVELENGVGP